MFALDLPVLRAVCNTLLPQVISGPQDSPEAAIALGTGTSDLGLSEVLAGAIAVWPKHVRQAVTDVLAFLGPTFSGMDAAERAARWRDAQRDPGVRPGATILQVATLAMFYTLTDESGANPTWPALGYAGPLRQPPEPAQFPKTLRLASHEALSTESTYDVIVIGSGAGGSVVAARLAGSGRRVLIVERGGYRNEPDFPQLESVAGRNLYLGGGYSWSKDASIGALAGSTVGGGTTINSMACLAPAPPRSSGVAAGRFGRSDRGRVRNACRRRDVPTERINDEHRAQQGQPDP
ncbi:GMC family oxidoreductase N-terminal domain-containing protein [Streptomyces sp. ISID311]|uniref:GMC family oxidoreductase N-terminal domain-containing protein n=1 Tax=Streptomyces sp. ISID311 TaxID=2601673 RepID=UPI00164C68FB